MSNHYCPVEDCQYPPDSDGVSLSRVRSHINATSEGAHDWGELKPVVLDQANDQDDPSTEQEQPGDGDDPDEAADEYEEQWSSTHDRDDDPPGGAGAAASTTDEADDEADEQATSGGSGQELPVSTPVVVVGLALVVLVAFLAIHSPSGEPTATENVTTDEGDEAAEDGGAEGPDIPEEGAWA